MFDKAIDMPGYRASAPPPQPEDGRPAAIALAPAPAASSPDVYRGILQVAKLMAKTGIAKASRNEAQNWDFRSVDQVYNALATPLADAELLILPRMTECTREVRTTKKGEPLFYSAVHAEFDFVSARDGSMHLVSTYGEATDTGLGDKATQKAMSYAWKAACLMVFRIPTEPQADVQQEFNELRARYQALGQEASYTEILSRWQVKDSSQLDSAGARGCYKALLIEVRRREAQVKQ